ncbi:hypothetical protein JQ633_18150 [Bradyrhizobium tropiciagri]|uniref:beta strand repeat-containing protein n=1 Tax=Bradyrhizobium tropiciagri TaxID=312253 RepID=UPI001BA4D81E|nr:FG-GAP-like repeat-containing protein [Bradyrhizobium tropiciagri]MBR0872293.1 hypothetical protein [Bradyrhizobium tropiciagri]
MAAYTHTASTVPSAIAWYNVGINTSSPVALASNLMVLANSDGTQTRLIGTGFTYSGTTPTGGFISEIDRTGSDGATIYETVTGLTTYLPDLINSIHDGNRLVFRFVFENADTFTGFAGNDFFVGGPGADAFTGGGGTNTVSYDNATAAVRADLGNPATNTGDAAGDTYSNVQNLTGSDFNDFLFGNGVANVLTGGKGNDFMGGGGGDDVIDGGAGYDTSDYANATAGITVVLSATSSVTGNSSVGTDTLISVENIRGTNFADSFTATTSFVGENRGFTEFEGLGGNDVITGNSSTRVAYGFAASGVTVDLLAGTAFSTAAGDAAGIGVDSFAGVVGPNDFNAVNAVRGSQLADNITAAGARGFFQFIGLGGNDTLTGSTEAINNFDFNLARYDYPVVAGKVNTGVVVVLDTVSTVSDKPGGTAAGTDTLIDIERVRGSDLADSFTANAGFDGPYGNENFFEGGGGNDTISGNGHTWAQYSDAFAAVTVNLQTGIGQSTAGGDAAGVGIDTLTGVNGVLGSRFADTLIGSNGAQAEQFYGDAGNDTINGGGGLLDRVVYQGAPAGVTVNLATQTATDGFGTADTIINIEGVLGSEFNDWITGDSNDNRLIGQDGDDYLAGGAGNDILVGDDGVDLYANAFGTGGTDFDTGNDVLIGGAGADTLTGGNGGDTFVYAPGSGADVVTDFVEGAGVFDRISLIGFGGLHSLTDALAFASQIGSSTVFDFGGGDTLTLQGVTKAHLVADDFIFAPVTRSDFDGNFRDDINWVNNDGRASIWDNGQIGGAHIIAPAGTISGGWHVVGSGDFDGNGKSDMLLVNDNGKVSIWDNGQIGGAHIIAPAGTITADWKFAGTGDFDGNGKSDILWVNGDGMVSIWDNGQLSGGHIVAPVGSISGGWHFGATGDFDGNGRSDVLLFNDDGRATVWDNGQIGTAHSIAPAGTIVGGWHVVGTGDFDANGKSDILLVNDNGKASIWDNGQTSGAHIIAPAGTISNGWHFADIGDYDSNGQSDIVWRNDNSAVSIWDNGQIGGAHIVASAGVVPNDWHIV